MIVTSRLLLSHLSCCVEDSTKGLENPRWRDYSNCKSSAKRVFDRIERWQKAINFHARKCRDLSSSVSKRHLVDLFYNEEQAKIAQKEDLQFPSSMIGDYLFSFFISKLSPNLLFYLFIAIVRIFLISFFQIFEFL